MPITMTLTVLYRGTTSIPTAKTLLALEAVSVAANATVTITAGSDDSVSFPDTSPVQIGIPPCAVGPCTAAMVDATSLGDEIIVRSPQPDRVLVNLTFLGSFPDNNNLCVAGGVGTTTRTFTMTFDGVTASAGSGYRITSYMVPQYIIPADEPVDPNEQPPSDAYCDLALAYVRVPSVRPSITAVSPTMTRLGRFPLNVVLALDKSGSMGGSGDTRWDRLKDSAEELAEVWGVVGAPGTAGADGHPEDQLGVVFFDSSVSAPELGGTGNFFLERGPDSDPWTGPLLGEMNAVAPGGTTSIGAAILAARQQQDAFFTTLFGSGAATAFTADRDSAVFIFTDGEQNRPPCVLREGQVQVSGCSFSGTATSGAKFTLDGSNASPPTPPQILVDVPQRGPIYTIGFGEDVLSEPGDLLDDIAKETAGTGWIANDVSATSVAFNESLLRILQGSTVSSLGRIIDGKLSASSSATASLDLLVDASVTRIVFILGWEEPESELELEITGPGPSDVQLDQVARGRRSLVARVDLPESSPSGQWQARVINRNRVSVDHDGNEIGYRLDAWGVESRLSFVVTESRRVGTGRPLQIVAEVGWDGEALVDLPPGAIQARIAGPGENLGNILHDAEGSNPDPRSDQTAVGAKIAALMESADLLNRVEPPYPSDSDSDSIALQHVGHGRYEGSFNGVSVGGQYRVRVDFDWDEPRTGRIRREQWTERRAAVVPTPDDTIVEVGPISGRGTGLRITPIDGFGNRIVGYANRFRVIVAGKPVDQAVVDTQLRGIYELDLTAIVGGGDPVVEIVFDGATLRKGPLSGLSKPGLGGDGGTDGSGTGSGTGSGMPWWVWLLLLILVVLLFWYLLG